MKAAVYTEFGPPEVLHIAQVETPSPKDDEMLVRIHAAAVAAEDPPARAEPGLNGFGKPNKPILRWYIAGEVEAVGAGVTQFSPGDRVYGSTGPWRMGAYAEYVCLPAEWSIVEMPAGMTYTEAAAIPNGALTALPFLVNRGRIQRGDKVLINGASGAVGTAAVQIAKHLGAEVTGVCSTANLELVRSLGAEHVIDYTQEDFTRGGQAYDIIFDAVGKSSFAACRPALNPGGAYLSTVPLPGSLIGGLLRPEGKRSAFAATGMRRAHKKAEDLRYLNGLIEKGELRAVIDRCYPLEEVVEAHRYVEKGHKKGNVIITIDP